MTKSVLLAMLLLAAAGCDKATSWPGNRYDPGNRYVNVSAGGNAGIVEFYLQADSFYTYHGPDVSLSTYSGDPFSRGVMVGKDDHPTFLLRYKRDEGGKLRFDNSFGNFFMAARGWDTVMCGTDISSSVIELTDSVLDKNSGIYNCTGTFQFYSVIFRGPVLLFGDTTWVQGHFTNIPL